MFVGENLNILLVISVLYIIILLLCEYIYDFSISVYLGHTIKLLLSNGTKIISFPTECFVFIR